MKKCLRVCHELDVSCPVKECRHWIDHEQEKNCVFESIRCNSSMTLREVGERLNISYVRVKQIQDKTLKKISHLLK
jgi:DNA-directed RNA polymerase specialized sigma subunit